MNLFNVLQRQGGLQSIVRPSNSSFTTTNLPQFLRGGSFQLPAQNQDTLSSQLFGQNQLSQAATGLSTLTNALATAMPQLQSLQQPASTSVLPQIQQPIQTPQPEAAKPPTQQPINDSNMFEQPPPIISTAASPSAQAQPVQQAPVNPIPIPKQPVVQQPIQQPVKPPVSVNVKPHVVHILDTINKGFYVRPKTIAEVVSLVKSYGGVYGQADFDAVVTELVAQLSTTSSVAPSTQQPTKTPGTAAPPIAIKTPSGQIVPGSSSGLPTFNSANVFGGVAPNVGVSNPHGYSMQGGIPAGQGIRGHRADGTPIIF